MQKKARVYCTSRHALSQVMLEYQSTRLRLAFFHEVPLNAEWDRLVQKNKKARTESPLPSPSSDHDDDGGDEDGREPSGDALVEDRGPSPTALHRSKGFSASMKAPSASDSE